MQGKYTHKHTDPTTQGSLRDARRDARTGETASRRTYTYIMALSFPRSKKVERAKQTTLPSLQEQERRVWGPQEPVPPAAHGPIEVLTTASVFHVGSVDSTGETFSCRVALHLEWIDMYYVKRGGIGESEFDEFSTHPEIGTRRARRFPNEDMSMTGELVPLEQRPRWTPELKFFGAPEAVTVIREQYSACRRTGLCRCFYEVHAKFSERLELYRFPFDRQLLCISVGSQHRAKRLIFKPHPARSSQMKGPNISDWRFSSKICTLYSVADQRAQSSRWSMNELEKGIKELSITRTRTKEYHSVHFHLMAERKCAWFFTNVFSTTYLLGVSYSLVPWLSSHSSFELDVGFADRLALLFTVFLTLSVYKTWIAQHLPLIEYWTIMDLYMVSAIGVVSTFWCLESFAMEVLSRNLFVTSIDYITWDMMLGVAYGASWTASHLLFYATRESILRKAWPDVFNSQEESVAGGDLGGSGKLFRLAKQATLGNMQSGRLNTSLATSVRRSQDLGTYTSSTGEAQQDGGPRWQRETRRSDPARNDLVAERVERGRKSKAEAQKHQRVCRETNGSVRAKDDPLSVQAAWLNAAAGSTEDASDMPADFLVF